jgi:outer membrane protein assembly factor BamD
MRAFHRFLLMAFIVSLAGCASVDDQDTSKWSAARFYSEAQSAIKLKNYETAISHLESIEGRFPYGPYAKQAALELAYVYMLSGETESSIAAADRFIKTHPQDKNVDYAYYLRGLALFEKNRSFIYEAFNQNPNHRDAEGARRSFQYFAQLVRKFPDSKYSKDAQQRMIHLRNRLAAYEVYVARFYLDRDAYVAASNRAKYVVENYNTTPAVADALEIMVQAYRKMGMNKLADDSMRVLLLNYPGHPGVLKLQQGKQ